MPIRFRCSYCNRLLGIATRKAGMQTTCPHCGNSITVPIPNEGDDGKTERMNLDDIDEMLGKSGGATIRDSAVAAPPAPPAAPTVAPPPVQDRRPEVIEPEFEDPLSLPRSQPAPKKSSAPAKPQAPPEKAKVATPPLPKPTKPKKPIDPNNPPLFEGNIEDILGPTVEPEEEKREKPPATSGMDARSLGDQTSGHITLSSGTATLLMAAIVVLLGLAFAAGYLLAPK
jgi:phage FluMu protein Com